MVFFLVVPTFMIVCILLTYGLSNRLGLRIFYMTLLGCAIMSLLAAYVAVVLSPAPDKMYFVRLFGLVLTGSVAVTTLNYFLVKREEREQEDFQAQVKSAYLAEFENGESGKVEVKEVSVDDLDTLKELVEYADNARVNGDIRNAVAAYKKVLKNHGDDKDAPFAAMDLIELFKENCAYTNAVASCEFALEMSSVKGDPKMAEEFKHNLEHLKKVRTVLSKHDALSTPYSQIPEDFLKEIDMLETENS